jgi:hypothetical protein
MVSSSAAEEETAPRAHRDAPHALAIVIKLFQFTGCAIVRLNASFH